MGFRHILYFPISLLAFISTFYAIGKFMLFLSMPGRIRPEYVWLVNLMDNKSILETAIPAATFDIIYITLFMLQHSLMKSEFFKTFLENIGLGVISRSIYTLASSACLLYLMENWHEISTVTLWQINCTKGSVLWWTFVLIHLASWIVIYGGSIIMDLPEILGIKQVYYDMIGESPPIAQKSFDLRNLYSHIRHPSFTGFFVIFWATNIMTLDRLLMASILSLYMFISWATDKNDVRYQKYQLDRKKQEIYYYTN